MKKLALLSVVFASLWSCKNEDKKDAVEEVKTTTEIAVGDLTVVEDSTKVNWTGFKTTEKVGVTGTFTKLKLEGLRAGNTPEEILEGAHAKMTTASLSSNNEVRDGKLKNIFFGAMQNTELIDVIFNFRGEKLFTTVTMNGVTKELEAQYTVENNILKLNTELLIGDFGAQAALDKIHEACYDLHKGADGVSKTWDTVTVTGEVHFMVSK
jgi:hypothetical protein